MNEPAGHNPTRLWIAVLALLGGAALLWTFDGPISDVARGLGSSLGGDLKRELDTLQQFGGVGSLAIVSLVVWFADPPMRRRLLDLGAAAGLTSLAALGLKMLVGRPRPKFEDPQIALGPLGAYPITDADPPGVYRAWDLSAPISSDLWSMPSSHTSAAVVLAVFLAIVYPRLIPLAAALAVIVGLGRVLMGWHYPSDVLVGAAVGLAVAVPAVRGFWGTRLLDWIWRSAIDRNAEAAYPALAAACAARRDAV